MDVDLLTLPLKVTVGLVVWTIALLTYRVFQAVVDGETFTPSAKSPDTKAPPESKNSTGEYFLKSSEPCTCTGVITGVVTYISESDRFRLFHGEPGFSQMEVPLHVRLTGLEKPQPAGPASRARMLETVLEIEDESKTSSATSSVTSRGLPLNPYSGSFTLPHDHHGTFQHDGLYVDNRLPGTHKSWKNSKWNVSDGVNVDFKLPWTHYSPEKETPLLEIGQVPHSERNHVNQDVLRNARPSVRNDRGDFMWCDPFVDGRLPETYNSWKKPTPSPENVQGRHSECNYIKQDVPSNISPPISVIPLSDHPVLPDGNVLSNSGPKYDQLYKKLHQELSKFNIQKKTNPNQSNHNDAGNSNVTDHDVMMLHMHAHNQAVAELYNDNYTSKGNMISFSPKITPEKKTSIDNNEIALVNPLKIPPSITPRLKQVPHYHGEVLAPVTPVLEHQYVENLSQRPQEFSISHETETSLDGVETHVNVNQLGDFPSAIIPNPESMTKPHSSIRKGLKLEANPSNPLLEELRVKLPRINIDEQNHPPNQILIPDQHCGYGQIIRKPQEITVKDINLDGNYEPEDLQTILDLAERDDAGSPPSDDNMHSMCKDSARICPPVLHRQLASRTSVTRSDLETFSPGHKSLDFGAGAIPGNLISIRRLSSGGSSSISSSCDGWSTTWDDSPCDPSTPDSDIPTGTIYGLVTLVNDGDGFRLLQSCDGISALDEVRVRLAGIDAPEHPDQPFSEESKTHLAELVLQKYVDVETFGTDQYGRVLGMVYLPSSFNVNLEMVRSGYAHVYTSTGAVYGEYEEDFKRLEKEAKILKKGLWSQEVVVLPGEFKRLRHQKYK